MGFSFEKFPIEGLVKVIPDLFKDNRGYFLENYNTKTFCSNGITSNFIQDNVSFSKKNVIRGLHYQVAPFAQAKLVSVMSGEILDIAVDIRSNSSTFGKYVSVVLSEKNREQLYVPEGFAHGFIVLSSFSVVQYKVSAVYSPVSERGIIWNDPDLNIAWGVDSPILSDKDKLLPFFKKSEVF